MVLGYAAGQGRLTRFDLTALTVEEFDALERQLGATVRDIVEKGSAVQLRRLAVAVLERDHTPIDAQKVANGLKLGEIVFDLEGADLPTMFEEYMPDTGGWTSDRFICFFAAPPFGWPPDVVRRQRIRDLRLLQDAFEGWKPYG